MTREEPIRGQTKESDVVVPFLKAVIYGVTGGTLSLLASVPLTLANDWSLWFPPIGAGVTGLLSFSLAWTLLDADARRTLWKLEEWAGADIDGYVGEPQKTVRVELSEPEKKAMRFLNLPVSDETLRDVAMAVLRNGRPFSRRALAGIIPESDFNRLHGAMIQAGLARYKGSKPNAGTELTPAGRAVLKHFL